MRMVDTARFRDADKYASYLKTMAGRLRLDLAWENLRPLLPGNASKRRALDLGGGTGSASVKLAEMGFEVVLLDSSEEMLGIARQQAEASGVAARIPFRHADAGQLAELFAGDSFDVVVCHNLLEYVEEPARTVRDVARVLRDDAVVSVLVRNSAGEVLRAAIKSGDWALATANLSAQTVTDSLFGEPVRVFAPMDLRTMLAKAGLGVIAERGVRVFSDYLDLADDLTGEAYRQVFELERILGAQPQFAAIARYIQMFARRSSATSSGGPER
jgi:S-adenosylmethionine-dependent methyltransferase